ncbi:glycosyltransferase family 4 protein [Flavobacterium sp. Arc2]|uniref:glycosyltransferase family 4 protein n=1 Tax=Flavobacterium sp. Arc2 TaxID=3046685 RepID=UPI00352C96E2
MVKNKILFILHLPPPVHGSSMVGQYIKDSKLVNQEFDAEFVNLGTSKSIDEIGKNPLKKIRTYFAILINCISQCASNRPNLVYFAMTAKGIGFYKDAFLIFFIKLFRVPLVLHFHNKGVSTRQDKWMDHLLYRFVFKDTKIILLSSHLYADIEKYVSKENVYYCPNGIPEIATPIKTNGNKLNRVSILFLSNLIASKGVFVLLEACKMLKEKKFDFNCVFVGGIGDVSEEQFYAKRKELGLEDIVVYKGRKYGQEKEKAFAEADIFVFPTYYHNETFGLVNLEAMQFSLPIISTYEGGIPDVVVEGVTGFLVPQQNVEALAAKMELLLNSSELRQKMGVAGRVKYEKEFTLTAFENKMTHILTAVLK